MYKSRTSQDDDNLRGDGSDDDEMYDEVDRFHNRKEEEFLQLGGHDDDDDGSSSSEDDGVTKGREGVFDLGVGGSSDEDDSNDDDDEEKVEASSSKKKVAMLASSSSDDDDDDDSDDDDDEKKSNLLNWGAKKHSYYHGDTADLEIGQDVDDAYLEEEAGREVEKARLEDMEEGDFMLDGDQDEEEVEVKPKKKKQKKSSSRQGEEVETILQPSKNTKQMSKLSKKEKIKLLKANHPELLPLVQHFSGSVQDLVDSTMVASGALLKNGAKAGKKEAQAIGATSAGLQYLITKSMLQASKALNLSLYLLLKADQAKNAASTSADSGAMFMDDDNVADDIRNHPVIDRLNQLSQLSDKLENLEENTSGLKEQLSNLVKAATMVDGGDVSSSDNDDDSEVDGEDNVGGSDDEGGSDGGDAMEKQQLDPDDATESSSSDSDIESEEAVQRRVMTEARFALRNQDIDQDTAKSSSRKRRLAPSSYDYGDETEELTEKAVNAGRKLASTMNSLSQKSASSSKKSKALIGDEVERDEDEYEQLQRGLSMMEAEFGGGSDDDDDDDDGASEGEEEGFGDDDDGDFYQKIKSKSMAKKKAKKQMYAVAPKYPRLDNEVEGERTIGRTILKNRGLVAHKPKINRNPRVKKREQYRKALIRRKGAVREVRTEEGHVYGGETTGIKSGISRSRKL